MDRGHSVIASSDVQRRSAGPFWGTSWRGPLTLSADPLCAETLLPHMREQADAWQSSHAIMSKNVTITPMTVQSRSCPSTLSIGSSLVPSLFDSKRLNNGPFGNSVFWLKQLFYS